jgi:hypothetical protein
MVAAKIMSTNVFNQENALLINPLDAQVHQILVLHLAMNAQCHPQRVVVALNLFVQMEIAVLTAIDPKTISLKLQLNL